MKFVCTIFVLFAAINLAHASFKNNDELVLVVSSDRDNTLNGRVLVTLFNGTSSQVIQFDKTNLKENDGKTYLYAKGDIPKKVDKTSVFYDTGNFENLYLHSLTINFDDNQRKKLFLMEKSVPSNTHHVFSLK